MTYIFFLSGLNGTLCHQLTATIWLVLVWTAFKVFHTYASEPIWCDHLIFASVQDAPGCPLCKIQSFWQPWPSRKEIHSDSFSVYSYVMWFLLSWPLEEHNTGGVKYKMFWIMFKYWQYRSSIKPKIWQFLAQKGHSHRIYPVFSDPTNNVLVIWKFITEPIC